MASLTVSVAEDSDCMKFILEGRIDASNAYNFSDALDAALIGYTGEKVVFECRKLDYISSAGLREFLRLLKHRKLAVRLEHVTHQVESIMNMTGFSQIFDVSGGN